MAKPKKPFNENTWQGQILDSVEDIRVLVETWSAAASANAGGGGNPGPPQTSYQDGTCLTCVHFLPVTLDEGQCRRYPPILADIASDGTVGSVPVGVINSFSCSEWRLDQ
jgi:hypothetical protein